jgi:hypothetical protein
MATTTSLTTTYSGKVAGGYIRAAFMSNETLAGITVKENIDYKQVVRRLVDDISFADATCDFTPTGDITLDERILEIKKLQIHRQICKGDLGAENGSLLQDWDAGDIQKDILPASLTDALIATILGGAGAKNEDLIWNGDSANAGEYDGFVTLIAADGTVVKPAYTTITSSNVIAQIGVLVAACPIGVKSSTEKPIIYMSQGVWEDFMIANAGAGNGWYTYGGPEMPKSYLGYQIHVCPGLPDNHMLMAQKSNLWFGTNILSDWNEVKVLDMTDLDASDNVRFRARFFAGVQYGFGSEIAAYGANFA